MTTRCKNWAIRGIAVAAMATVPMAAQAAGYIKIPDIPGESQRAKDSGDAHLDYLTITLNADGVETEDIGFKANDGATPTEDHSAGDEHEIEYDVTAGAFHGKDGGPAKIAGVRWMAPESVRRSDTGHGSRLTGIRAHKPAVSATSKPRDAAAGRPTGKRQHKPLRAAKELDKSTPMIMRASANWDQCKVGAAYPHIMLGDGEGNEYKLHWVKITECSREHVSFSYAKMG